MLDDFTVTCIVCHKERTKNFNGKQSNICPQCEKFIQSLDENVRVKKCIFCGTTEDVHYWEPVLAMVCESCKAGVMGVGE